MKVNYVDYKHSVAHAIEPKMKALKYNTFISKKPIQYCAKILFNAINNGEVRFTEKEQYIYDTMKTISDTHQLYAYARAIVENAKNVIVEVDEDGELV